MKFPWLPGLLLLAFFFTGCEAVVETREPARYGRVYERRDYHDRGYDHPHRDYYYRDGRRYERDVVVVQQPRVYTRSRPVVVARRPPALVVRDSNRRRDDHHDSHDRRDDNDRRDRDKKKKKEKDKDHDHR